MKRWIRSLVASLGIGATISALAEEVPPPQPAVSSRFSPGQVWRYKSRPGEEASRVIIGKIERAPKIGTIVHVKLTGLSLQSSAGATSVMSHAPVSEAQVSASVTELTNEAGDLEGFAEGYSTWLSSFRAGKAGVFTITLSEIAENMERVLNP